MSNFSVKRTEGPTCPPSGNISFHTAEGAPVNVPCTPGESVPDAALGAMLQRSQTGLDEPAGDAPVVLNPQPVDESADDTTSAAGGGAAGFDEGDGGVAPPRPIGVHPWTGETYAPE
jgi:hypothetical protein